MKETESQSQSQKVAMFKDRAGTWCQFDNAEHERRTRESGEYEVKDFVPVSAMLGAEVGLHRVIGHLEGMARGLEIVDKPVSGETKRELIAGLRENAQRVSSTLPGYDPEAAALDNMGSVSNTETRKVCNEPGPVEDRRCSKPLGHDGPHRVEWVPVR